MSVNINTKKFFTKLRLLVAKRIEKAAVLVEGAAKGSMTVSNNRGTNPSRPGEAPHVGTSALRNSITHKVRTSFSNSEVVAQIGVFDGPGAKYARRLELGFSGVDKKGRNYNQAERPFLRPALQKSRIRILNIIRKG